MEHMERTPPCLTSLKTLETLNAKIEQSLAPYAARSIDCQRQQAISTSALAYKQDVQSILNCKAYSRYMDKTQVIYLMTHDHVTKRALHVQLVSHLSRTIGRLLNLNTDLIEAIALGHDVGHPPFGHEGEQYLSEISLSYGEGPFTHSVQSCRLLKTIEPLDLGLAVYDGFLCHDGGLKETFLNPVTNKDWHKHHEECLYKQTHPDCSITPMTLEGCLVKMCDTISYVIRDLEDALRWQLITPDSIPDSAFGKEPQMILHHLIEDILLTSLGHPWIGISKESDSLLRQLRALNFTHFYFHPMLKKESERIHHSYRILCDFLLEEHERLKANSFLTGHFLSTKQAAYCEAVSPARAVIDFVAGMTDGFFLRTLRGCLIPGTIELTT